MPERSQPHNSHPHFSSHKLRRRAAEGRGEIGSEQAQIDRLFVTTPEGGRPDPKILDAADVARGFGLPLDQVDRLTQVVRETRADFATKGGNQRVMHARGHLIETMRSMTPHIPSDVRQEVLRRAISYWKSKAPVDLARTPEARYVVRKGGGHKYIKRVATGDPKKPWRYVYAEDGQREISKIQKMVRDLRKQLWQLKHQAEAADPSAFDSLRSTASKGLTAIGKLYSFFSGRKVPKKGGESKDSGTKRGPREGKERNLTTKGALAKALLKAYRELEKLIGDVDEAKAAAEKMRSESRSDSSGPTGTVTLPDHWSNHPPGKGPLFSAGLTTTGADVGYTRVQLQGTLEQFRAAIENVRKESADWTGADKRSANSAIQRLQAQADLLDPEVQARKEAEREERQRAREQPGRSVEDLTAAGGKLWEKHGKRRVYFNRSVTGIGGAKVWYDLDKKAWGYRGNYDGWKGQSPEEIEADLDSWLDDRISGASVKVGVPKEVAEAPPAPPPEPEPEPEPQPAPKVSPKETPRGDAVATTRDMFEGEDGEYVNTRKSAFRQRGEDFVGSARHRAMEWKSLGAALNSPDANKMFTRDFLDAENPMDLIGELQKDDSRTEELLYLHLLSRKFPKKPPALKAGGGKSRDDVALWFLNDQIRQQGGNARADTIKRMRIEREWHDMSEARRDEVEKEYLRAQREGYFMAHSIMQETLRGVLNGEISRKGTNYDGTREYTMSLHDTIRKAIRDRAADYNENIFAREMMRKLYKAAWGTGKTSPNKASRDFVHKAAMLGMDVTEASMQVLEGETPKKVLGETTKRGKQRRFDVNSAYNMGLMEREGAQSEVRDGHHAADMLDGREGGKYGMRGIQYGKSLPDDERAHHLKACADSFADLTDILGLPPEMASYNGRLGIALGARGKGNALAHYEPQLKVINITRARGAGSLAHEWGHFFDYMVETLQPGAGRSRDDSGAFERSYRFAADREEDGQSDEKFPVRAQMHGLMTSPAYRGFSRRVARVAAAKYGEKAVDYWTSHREQWARCFERYVQRKLEKAGRKNTYLVGVKKEDMGATEEGLWPTDEEIDGMAPHFDAVFKSFRESDLIKKALAAYVIPLQKALNAEYGRGPTGFGGPSARDQSLPDFSIYQAPEWQGRRAKEVEAAENRLSDMREKNRGYWGAPPERDPQLRYDPNGIKAEKIEDDRPRLGITKPTHIGPKEQIDRLKAPQKPYEREDAQQKAKNAEEDEDEDEDSPKKPRKRKLVVRRSK